MVSSTAGWAPCNLCLKSDKMNQAKWDKTLLPHSQNELIIYIKEKILETQLGWFNSEINTMQKCQLWPQTWSFLHKAQSISEVRQEMFSREHYWVQGGLQQYYSSPSCPWCQVHAVPSKVPPMAAGWLQSSTWHQRANSRAVHSSLGDAVPCYVE